MDEAAEPVTLEEGDGADGRAAPVDDAELLAAVREGSMAAYGLLYTEFRPLALRRARRLLGRHQHDAEDVVEMAFASILEAILNGSGPVDNFVRYLVVTVRHTVWRTVRRRERELSLGGEDLFEPAPDPQELLLPVAPDGGDAKPEGDDGTHLLGAVAAVSSGGLDPALLLSDAFTALTERHRAVLWLAEVEGREPAEIAVLLGMTPNSTAALCYRARKALWSNYFGTYAAGARPECVPVVPRLASFVDDPTADAFDDVAEHAGWCASCRDVVRGVAESRTMLSAMAPFGLLSAGEWLRPRVSPAERSAVGAIGAGAKTVLRRPGRSRRVLAATAAVLVMASIVAVAIQDPPDGSPREAGAGLTAPIGDTGSTSPSGRSVHASDSTRTSTIATRSAAPASTAPPGGVTLLAPTTTPPSGGTPSSVPPIAPTATVPPVGGGPVSGDVDGLLRVDRDGVGPLAVAPAAGIPVLLQPTGGGAPERTVSRSDGRFDVQGLDPGAYTALAMVPVGVMPRESTEEPVASGSTQTVVIGTVNVAPGDRDSLEVDLVPWRTLSVSSLGADRTQASAGDAVAWQVGLRSTPAAVTGVDVTIGVPLPPGARVSRRVVTIAEAAATSVSKTREAGRAIPVRCEDQSTAGRFVLVCRVNRVTPVLATLTVSVGVDAGASGRLEPLVAVGPGRGFAVADRVTGSSVALG